MGDPNIITAQKIALWIKERGKASTVQEIAEHFSVSVESVGEAIKQADIPGNWILVNKFTPIKDKEAAYGYSVVYPKDALVYLFEWNVNEQQVVCLTTVGN